MSSVSRTSRDTRFKPEPAPQKFRLSIDEMLSISYDIGRGCTMREIAARTHRSPTTVWKISQRVKNPVLAKPKKKQENFAPKITRHFISYALLSDPSTSAESMRKQLSIVGIETSTSTINRLVARMGFQSVYKAKKEKLDQRQRDKRVAFCRDIQLSPEFLLPWVFTDESLIVRNPTQGKIRVLRGIEEIEERFIETEGYPVKVMVWGCIGVNFKSTLMRIKGTMDAAAYQQMLTESGVFEQLDGLYGARGFIFQQDGARPHTAASTKRFLADRVRTLPPGLSWPARSPDLSVIENFWAVIKGGIDYKVVTDADTLFEEARRVWNSISMDSVNAAIRDFTPRIKTCIAIEGQALNGHRKVLDSFRVSAEAGQMALAESQETSQAIGRFKLESAAFFRGGLFKDKAAMQQLPTNQLYAAEVSNRWAAAESRRICLLLPRSIVEKMGLDHPD